MVNTAKLNEYVVKSGRSWAEHARDIGGIPEDIEVFAEHFEDFENGTTADDVSALVAALDIPACQIGLVFFAPAEYGEGGPRLATLKDFGDALAELFHGLSVKSRVKLMGEAFRLQDEEAAQ